MSALLVLIASMRGSDPSLVDADARALLAVDATRVALPGGGGQRLAPGALALLPGAGAASCDPAGDWFAFRGPAVALFGELPRVVPGDYRPQLGPLAWEFRRAPGTTVAAAAAAAAWSFVDVLPVGSRFPTRDLLLRQLAHRLEVRLAHGVDVAWHARRAGIRERTLVRWFRDRYGVTPNQMRRRLQGIRAHAMYQQDAAPEEIIAACGLRDRHHLARILERAADGGPARR